MDGSYYKEIMGNMWCYKKTGVFLLLMIDLYTT